MTTVGSPFKSDPSTDHKGSIVDDFMYGSNVATAHIYIRMGFLRKVYGILSTQLLITTLTGAFFILHEPTKMFVQKNSWMLMVAMFGTLLIMFALMFKQRETPTNYILLMAFHEYIWFFVLVICHTLINNSVRFLFCELDNLLFIVLLTAMEAYTVGVIVTFYDKVAVMEAFALTCAVTLGLTAYTFQSKRDFSSWGPSLFAVLWVLILAGFLQMFFPTVMMDRLIAIGGAIIFSLFIVYDTHMMMHKLSPEEYIVASINLYLDIINLFLYILRIVSESRK